MFAVADPRRLACVGVVNTLVGPFLATLGPSYYDPSQRKACDCCPTEEACCPAGQIVCNGFCCAPGEGCVDNRCVPQPVAPPVLYRIEAGVGWRDGIWADGKRVQDFAPDGVLDVSFDSGDQGAIAHLTYSAAGLTQWHQAWLSRELQGLGWRFPDAFSRLEIFVRGDDSTVYSLWRTAHAKVKASISPALGTAFSEARWGGVNKSLLARASAVPAEEKEVDDPVTLLHTQVHTGLYQFPAWPGVTHKRVYGCYECGVGLDQVGLGALSDYTNDPDPPTFDVEARGEVEVTVRARIEQGVAPVAIMSGNCNTAVGRTLALQNRSYDPDNGQRRTPLAGITHSQWTVTDPAGNTAEFGGNVLSLPAKMPGNYEVTLTVADDEGWTDTATRICRVSRGR